MLITTAAIAAPVVVMVGAFIWWANPGRRVNQLVFVGTLQMAFWLACWHLAVVAPRGSPQALLWIRWTNAAGALTPLSFWIVKEALLGNFGVEIWPWLRRRWLWLVVPIAIAGLPFTESFIPAASTGANQLRGPGYYVYMAAEFGFYAFLLFIAVKSSWTLTGVRRLELQVWLGGGCSMAITMWSLTALSTATHDPTYRRIMPLAMLAFYAATAFAITIGRIFDARQLLLFLTQKLALMLVVIGTALGLHLLLIPVLPAPIPFVLATAIALGLAFPVDRALNRLLEHYPQADVAREAAFAVSAREMRFERLEPALLGVLKGWGHAENALILSGGPEILRGGKLELADATPLVAALRELGWATPERLARERTTPERAALAHFLMEQALGVAVWTEGSTLSVLVGVGIPPSRRPYTYPQVKQLIELASIAQGALERAHFSVKAQHAEQLATVGLLGASLAHEIRNPLVTIKTFAQLLPKHYQDQTFRDKFFNLIGDEVTRIDGLTEQLLDLASPREYQRRPIDLHAVLAASVDLVKAKAADKRVEFRTELTAAPDCVLSDPSAVKQVLLNLCFNAIQAVERQPEPRWVKLSTRNAAAGVEMAVEDNGPGIAADIRPRLFQPFQTTKSSGFGLGLAICSDILARLDATIAADPAEPGRGATFRVLFPCQA